MARVSQRGPSKTSKRARASGSQTPAVPNVYYELLAEAASSSPTRFSEDGKTVKRRRIRGQIITQGANKSDITTSSPALDTANEAPEDYKPGGGSSGKLQTAYKESEDSAESDVAWEDVGVKDEVEEASPEESEELDLVLGDKSGSGERRRTRTRKPVTAAERGMRIDIHKMHLLSLLLHVGLRNQWCNDHGVQTSIRKVLPKKTLVYLDDDDKQSQFQRSRSFMDGLQQALEVFWSRYKITARGLHRPYWVEDAEQLLEFELPDDVDLPMQKEDFRAVSSKLEASRDVGAQLFCALLRSAGVETRLVCSLQILPFTASIIAITPVKPRPALRVVYPDTRTGTSDEDNEGDAETDTSTHATGSLPSRARSRLDGPQRLQQVAPFPGSHTVAPPINKAQRKRIRESPNPVYWVEAFNAAYQKWVPVDPLVTRTIGKPSRFEPPANDVENHMTYVIAFEEDGSAGDVTRRYTKAFNAKTRKSRIEATKGGERWWRRVLRMYRRTHALDRDQVEDAELAAKEAAEAMPRNVQDFKDHPYYALERHLRWNEAIEPKREVGKIKAGKPGSGGGANALEPVYRRRDVHAVKSADNWYRLGREIKTGEQPLKRIQSRRRREAASEDEHSGHDEKTGTPMYAGFQTTPYTAPPVIHGIVPRNAYGNLDIYVPSMVPPGGVHIIHPDTARAAKLLGIHYADAVTGFEFRGRHGTAVIRGAVVASEYRDAVQAVIRGYESERAEEEEAYRTSNALKMWRVFLKGLRIRERIEGYHVEGENSAITEEIVDNHSEGEDRMGGGFLPDADDGAETEPLAVRRFHQTLLSNTGESDRFVEEYSGDDDPRVENPSERWNELPQAGTQESAVDFGGGFLPEAEEGGEVVAEAEDEDAIEALRDIKRPEVPPVATKTPPHIEQEEDSANASSFDEDLSFVSLLDHGRPEHETAKVAMVQQGSNNKASNGGHHSHQPSQVDAMPQASPSPTSRPRTSSKLGDDIQALREEGRSTRYPANSTVPPQLDQRDHPGEGSTFAVISGGDSESEKGSLLSHDPSDEDADPDWLV